MIQRTGHQSSHDIHDQLLKLTNGGQRLTSSQLNMGSKHSMETRVTKQPTPCNNPEERRHQIHCSESLKSCTVHARQPDQSEKVKSHILKRNSQAHGSHNNEE
jgi:hypothetical protein